MNKKVISFLGIAFHILIALQCNSQGINNRFLFGYDDPQYNPRRNVSISTDSISVDSTSFALSFDAASANISDSAGNLLFYSNGNQVMNKLHLPMQGIDTLSPDWSTQNYFDQGSLANQEVLIVPQPADNNKYYIFSCAHFPFNNLSLDQTFKLQYSVIDMSLNGGLGACTQANVTLINDTLRNGGLTVCRHANGRDWWLPVKQWNNNKFYMLLITPNGIQNMGEQALGDTTCKVVDWSGQTAFSPDGHWYANIDARSDLNLYAFDRCSGTFTSSLHVAINDSLTFFGSVAFSQSSKILYYSNIKRIYQLNLDTVDILASKRIVSIYDGFYDPSTGGTYFKTYFGYSWLAPNGKIYLCTARGTKYFHVINSPDSLGQACDVQQHSLFLNCYNAYTTPNHYNYFLGAEQGSVCDTILTASAPSSLGRAGGGLVNPNPANTSFYFNYQLKEHAILQVYNSSGAIVHTQTLYSWFGYVEIDCSTWASGVYHLQVLTHHSREMLKQETKLVVTHP